jgi:hypothetical protein
VRRGGCLLARGGQDGDVSGDEPVGPALDGLVMPGGTGDVEEFVHDVRFVQRSCMENGEARGIDDDAD